MKTKMKLGTFGDTLYKFYSPAFSLSEDENIKLKQAWAVAGSRDKQFFSKAAFVTYAYQQALKNAIKLGSKMHYLAPLEEEETPIRLSVALNEQENLHSAQAYQQYVALYGSEDMIGIHEWARRLLVDHIVCFYEV